MTCQDARDRLSAALDGALDAGERQRLDVHLSTCADCQRERRRLEQTVGLLRETDPIRAPAGFVDRVLAAVRPDPWWRRLGRRLVTPWTVKLPLGAAAVALVAITTVSLYRGTSEQQHAVQDAAPVRADTPRQEAAPALTAAPPQEDMRVQQREQQPAALLPERKGQLATSTTEELPGTKSGPSVAADASSTAPPSPAASPPPPVPAAPPTTAESTGRGAHPSSERHSLSARSMPERPMARQPPDLLTTAPTTMIEGHLRGIAPASGRVQVTELVARLGGTIAAEGTAPDGAVIDILLARGRYDELARGLAQLGQWSAPDPAGDADVLHIRVRVEK